MQRLLAIDWGSSALRGALLDDRGNVLDRREIARGLLTIAPGGFGDVFEAHFGDWMRRPDTQCLMAGMVGSKQGWIEADYCRCPAGLDEVARALARVSAQSAGTAHGFAIVPGIACEHDGRPDVMRGEEVKIFGALDLLGVGDAVLLLPGTHSKWARVVRGRIESFSTVMTGEFYALLRKHSILARTLPEADGALDEAAFDLGIDRAVEGSSLMQTAFSVRTLALFERMPDAALPSYLSGLVIGEALRCEPLDAVASVIVIGAPALAQRFERGLRRRGVAARTLGDEAAWRGLCAIHRHSVSLQR
ncbi:MAG: 2-dehydro-3-deoxygalactonokinase [Caldimonas sp.]